MPASGGRRRLGILERLSSGLELDEDVCGGYSNRNKAYLVLSIDHQASKRQWNQSLACASSNALLVPCPTRAPNDYTHHGNARTQNTHHASFPVMIHSSPVPTKSHYRDKILPSSPQTPLLGLLQYCKLLTSCLGSPAPAQGLSCQANCWSTYPVPGVPP